MKGRVDEVRNNSSLVISGGAQSASVSRPVHRNDGSQSAGVSRPVHRSAPRGLLSTEYTICHR